MFLTLRTLTTVTNSYLPPHIYFAECFIFDLILYFILSFFIFIRRFHLISEELKNAQAYTKDFKQQILDLRGTLPSDRYVALLSFTRLTSNIHISLKFSHLLCSLYFSLPVILCNMRFDCTFLVSKLLCIKNKIYLF